MEFPQDKPVYFIIKTIMVSSIDVTPMLESNMLSEKACFCLKPHTFAIISTTIQCALLIKFSAFFAICPKHSQWFLISSILCVFIPAFWCLLTVIKRNQYMVNATCIILTRIYYNTIIIYC